MKITLVHDYLIQYGGAEKVLEALCEIFPNAPIYTLLYDPKLVSERFPNRKIHSSFLQKIPFIIKHHRSFLTLMPLAIEQFDFSKYDLVISDSASFAKGIITNPPTTHICYCYTPTRYLWDDCHRYLSDFRLPILVKKMAPYFLSRLRIWDYYASDRPDFFIANSEFVRQRIKKYYKKDSIAIYPPVGTDEFYISNGAKDYFLMVGRLLPYKKFDFVVKVFSENGLPLKVIGEGPEKKRLKKLAGRNIEFLGFLEDESLKKYYTECKALIFPQEEDFGIVPLEAMASGRPIIAYKAGGALETIVDGKTGVFFEKQEKQFLLDAISRFDKINWNPEEIREHAKKFDKEVFKKNILELLHAHRN